MSPRDTGKFEPTRRIAARAACAAWVALAFYCVLSLVAGPAGLLSYRRLEAKTAEMKRNIGELGKANEGLRVELESLRSDADRAAREARSLGYLRPGENAVLVAGRVAPATGLETGTIVAFTEPPSWPDSALKEIALGVFLAALAIGLAPRRER